MPRNRLLVLGAAVATALIAVAAIVVFAGSGSSSSSTTTSTVAKPGGATEAKSTFAGVPQSGDTLGKASAPLTLTVFEDPQCPFCRQWNIDTLPTVVQNYVRTGRIKIEYRGVVVIGGNSLVGLAAIYAAGEENKLWQMAEALYERQGDENSGWITLAVVRSAAREIGLNPATIVTAMRSASVTSAIRQSVNEAQSLGINGTPTFATQKPLGTLEQLQVSGLEPGDFTPALDQALQ
ncbi:MAG TPA: thioredoxin domain-containing protein [Gaiellaceae bacterium]|jgi:protein-disulfide isomerase